MPLKSCNKRCDGCALTPGAEANLEPDNHLTAMLAVMGPFPFYCHAFIDYKNLKSKTRSKKAFRENKDNFVLCTGWLEEVQKLAATGYYKENPVFTKSLAVLAKENLDIFCASDDPDDKEDARKLVERFLLKLAEKRQRFEREEVTA